MRSSAFSVSTPFRAPFARTALLLLALAAPAALAKVTPASSVEQAQERSAKSKKDYFVLNYGEWDLVSTGVYKSCWKVTRSLDKELENSTIIAEATFSDNPTDAEKKAQERRNKGLKTTPPSLPSVLLFDADGFLYATVTGTDLPHEERLFAEKLGSVQKKRIERDELIRQAMLKKGVERAKMLGAAADVQGIKPSPKILELVKAADPSDKSGYVRRLSFDIFKLHELFKQPDEKALRECDKYINDEGYSIEQRQMVCGLKAHILRKDATKNADKIKETYNKMFKLGPDTIMGQAGKKGLQSTFDISSLNDLLDKPVKDALKEFDRILADTSFPYSDEQRQDILDLRARSMRGQMEEYKQEIVDTYKKLIEINPNNKMAEYAQQEIDFLTLPPEELEKRQKIDRDDIQSNEVLGEEIYPEDVE